MIARPVKSQTSVPTCSRTTLQDSFGAFELAPAAR